MSIIAVLLFCIYEEKGSLLMKGLVSEPTVAYVCRGWNQTTTILPDDPRVCLSPLCGIQRTDSESQRYSCALPYAPLYAGAGREARVAINGR